MAKSKEVKLFLSDLVDVYIERTNAQFLVVLRRLMKLHALSHKIHNIEPVKQETHVPNTAAAQKEYTCAFESDIQLLNDVLVQSHTMYCRGIDILEELKRHSSGPAVAVFDDVMTSLLQDITLKESILSDISLGGSCGFSAKTGELLRMYCHAVATHSFISLKSPVMIRAMAIF
eukprot:Tbor_TRINITY_DN5047_c0_g1::TRINITY_DN5047_c0_g1_i2::g.14047::m.14047